MYLPMRHDEVGKNIFNEIIKKIDSNSTYTIPTNEVWKCENTEIWWDTPIKTTPKTKCNKPDMILWEKEKKNCKIIDICIPLDEM